MALTNTQCKNGQTQAGGSVSTYDIFDGEGYCKVVNKTSGVMDFRLYGRAHSYNSSANTISISMYLFGRKNENYSDSWNNDQYSKVEFTCGSVTKTYTSSHKGVRVEKSGGDVRLLGSAEMTGVSLATGSKTFKAVWKGINGTEVSGDWTISETMYWNKNNSSDQAPAITVSNITTSGCTAKVSPLRPGRNCYTSWVWNRKNTTTGDDWTDGVAYTVGYSSDSTSHTQEYSSMSAGNTYTLKFTCYLRNYNGLKETSTRKAPLWSVTKSVTLNKNTGYITLDKSSLTLKYGGSNGTVKITSAHSMSAVSSSTSNESVFTRDRNTEGDGKTVTIFPKGLGTATLTVNCAATTGYTADSATCSVTVQRNPIASLPSAKSGLVYTGSSQTGVSGGAHWTAVSGTTGTSAGSYTAKVKPATGYAWSDGTTTEKSIPWSIGKANCNMTVSATSVKVTYGSTNSNTTISTAHVSSPSYTYATADTSIATTSIGSGKVSITGKKVGTTSVSITHGETDNYKSKTVTISITVERAKTATEPTATNRTYTGSSQNGYSSKGNYNTLSGNSSATNAGSYQFYATPDSNHAWSDGTTTKRGPYSWTMNQATGTLTLNGTAGNITKEFTYGDANGSVTVGGVGGTVSITSESSTTIANGTLASQTSLTVDPGNAGTATIKLKRAASTNYTASPERTVTVTVKRNPSLVVPTGATREWTGSSQTCTDSSTTYMTLDGTTSATASTDTYYTFTATPDANHAWKDGTYAQKSINWYLKRKPDAVPPTKADRVWTGSQQNGYSSAGSNCTLSTVKQATDAGSYSYTATPNANHAWSDGTYAAKTFNWIIDRAVINVPVGAIRKYNGSPQSWTDSSTTYMSISGVIQGVNISDYTATATPDNNHKWPDGTTTGKPIAWSIILNNIAEMPTVQNYTYDGTSKTGYSGGNYVSIQSTTTATSAGSYSWVAIPKYGYSWKDDNTTTPRTGYWNIARSRTAVVPTKVDRIWNGSEQYGCENWNITKVSMSGTYIATDPGKYTWTATPTANYAWEDGSTSGVSQSWTITKYDSNITLSPSTLTTSLKETQTYAVTGTGESGGALLATVADTSIASVSVKNNVATITAHKLGTTTIDFKIAASGYYNESVVKTFTLTVRPAEVKLGTKTTPVYLGSKPVRRVYVGDKIVIF